MLGWAFSLYRVRSLIADTLMVRILYEHPWILLDTEKRDATATESDLPPRPILRRSLIGGAPAQQYALVHSSIEARYEETDALEPTPDGPPPLVASSLGTPALLLFPLPLDAELPMNDRAGSSN